MDEKTSTPYPRLSFTELNRFRVWNEDHKAIFVTPEEYKILLAKANEDGEMLGFVPDNTGKLFFKGCKLEVA